MRHIHGDHATEEVREISIFRRHEFNADPLVINNETRICFRCSNSIRDEIAILQANPMAMRVNGLKQTRNNTCFLCNAVGDLHRLSIECKVEVFIQCNIFFPETVRSCAQHLDRRGHLLLILLADLQSINRPYIIPGQYLQRLMQAMRDCSLQRRRIDDIEDLSDDQELVLTSFTKQ
ncbi:hypothetical protein TKK_0000173 [Trichogramma kaykai]